MGVALYSPATALEAGKILFQDYSFKRQLIVYFCSN